MSFFTSFCDLPQKLQQRVSRFSKIASLPARQIPGTRPSI
jgi:hypothetical protein